MKIEASTSSITVQRKTFILSIWSERQVNGAAVWRGYLETGSGQRFYFDSIAYLTRLLCEHGGWNDAETQRE